MSSSTSDPPLAPRPSSITGGCLCNSIRFTISFPLDTPWPPKSATCQCTMCRKWTSSLVAQFIILQPCQLTPPLTSFSQDFPTYTEYESSTRRYRGFCSRCGSTLVWRSGDRTDALDLFLGTVDQKWLVENKEIGRVLGMPNQYQFWCENAITGVTDVIRGGRRFLQEDDGSGTGELLD